MRRTLAAVVAMGLTVAATAADPIRVAVYDDTGAGPGNADAVLAVLAETPGGYRGEKVTAAGIRDGKLAGFAVVAFPGGTGGGQGKALEDAGRAKVRAFVEAGGGYVGFCAGAYLATDDYSWSLGLLKAQVIDKAHWNRGRGTVELVATAPGRERLGLPAGDPAKVMYHQGPLLKQRDGATPACEVWATFGTEVRGTDKVPEGVMRGTTAILAGTFGTGRVVAISPHPEKTAGQHAIAEKAIGWAAKR